MLPSLPYLTRSPSNILFLLIKTTNKTKQTKKELFLSQTTLRRISNCWSEFSVSVLLPLSLLVEVLRVPWPLYSSPWACRLWVLGHCHWLATWLILSLDSGGVTPRLLSLRLRRDYSFLLLSKSYSSPFGLLGRCLTCALLIEMLCQSRSEGLFPGLGFGGGADKGSAGHVSILHPEILGVTS